MERKAYVDFAKCLAILVVLCNHIGLILPGVSAFGGMFYVPIFFVLAGYTCRASDERYVNFAKKKATRLLVPYVAANLVYLVVFLAKDLLTGRAGAASLWPLVGILYSRYSLYPPESVAEGNVFFLTIQNSPTWFLTALFLTYLLFELIRRIADTYSRSNAQLLSALISAVTCLFLGVVLHYSCPVLLPWSLECVPLFVLYMLAGYGVRHLEIDRRVWERGGVRPYAALLLLGAAVWLGFRFGGSANISIGSFGNYVVLGVLNGITSSLLVLMICMKLNAILPKGMCAVGRCTLHILCYHLLAFLGLETGCGLFLPGLLNSGTWQGEALKLLCVAVTVIGITLLDLRGLPLLRNLLRAGKSESGSRSADGAGKSESESRPADGAGKSESGSRWADGAGKPGRGSRPADVTGRPEKRNRSEGDAGTSESKDSKRENGREQS